MNENETNDSGTETSSKGTSVSVPVQNGSLRSILGRALQEAPPETLPTEVRRVRRGKFFLSRYEQTTYGSIRQPIFAIYCHEVVVGETVPDDTRDGIWCYGAHNDFDLIPEFQPPSSWPEYTRTSTGWVRVDGNRRLGEPSDALGKLLDWNMKQLRLTVK